MQPMALLEKKVYPPLPPLPVTVQQFNATATPRMKGMRYREVLCVLPLTGCSPHLDPNKTAHPASTRPRSLGRLVIALVPLF